MPSFIITFGQQHATEPHPVRVKGVRPHPNGWVSVEADSADHAKAAADRLFGNNYSMVREPQADDAQWYPLGELADMVAPAQELLDLVLAPGIDPGKRAAYARRRIRQLWIPADSCQPITVYTDCHHSPGSSLHIGASQDFTFYHHPGGVGVNHRALGIAISMNRTPPTVVGDVVLQQTSGRTNILINTLINSFDQDDPVWAVQS